MKKVSIRILLDDPMGNSHTLDVTNDEFGVLKYNFYGTNSRTPFSLSNMQIGWKNKDARLPDTIDDYKNVHFLTADIIEAIHTGTERLNRVVYRKSM